MKSTLKRIILGGGARPNPLFNFKASQFTQWAAGVAAVKASSRRSMVLCVGESVVRGEWGGDSGDQWINTHINAYPAKIADYLAGLGLATNKEDLIAMGGNAGVVPIAQHRGNIKIGFNAASPWAQTASTSIGGCMMVATGAATLSYTPEINVDTFELWDIQASGAGTISWNVDGGADTNRVQTNATSAFLRTTIAAGALGAHTLNVKWVSGTGFFLGVRSYNSAVKGVDVVNAGRGGALASEVANKAANYASGAAIATLASSCDMIVIGGEQINDGNVPTAISTYKTNIQTLITDAKAGGASVLLVTGNPVATTSTPNAVQQSFRQALKDLASLNDVPLFDQYAAYGSYDAMNARGFMANVFHPNKAGYADLALRLGQILATYGAV